MIDVTEASVSDKKKPRGRPKLEPKTEILDSETPLAPEFSKPEQPPEPETPFDGDAFEPFPPIQPKSSFETLSNFWNKRLTPAQRRQGTVYVYRLWPKMKLVPGRGRLVNENCEKFNEEDGPVTRELIRKRRRMGIYLLRLNQRIVKPSCEISNCEVEISGDLANVDDMPILDIENLDLEHPSNEEYVRVLRSRGIIKADSKEGEGADDMAASEVLGHVLNKSIDALSERSNSQNQQPMQVSGDGVGKELVGLLREQINQGKPPEQQGTVIDMVKSLVEIGTIMKPEKQDFGPFLSSIEKTNQMVLDLKEQEVKRAQADAERARVDAQTYRQQMPQPLSLDEQWDQLERASKRFNRMTGRAKDGDETTDEERKAGAASAAGFLGILGSLPLLLEKGAQIFQTFTVYRYNEKLQPGQLPINPITGQADGQPAQPPVSVTQPQQQTQPQQEQSPEMQAMTDILNQVERIRPLLLNALRKNRTGHEFAKQLIDLSSEEEFDALKLISITVNTAQGQQVAVGKDAVWVLIQNTPAIWEAEIAPGVQLKTQSPRLMQFLNEFFAYSPVAVN